MLRVSVTTTHTGNTLKPMGAQSQRKLKTKEQNVVRGRSNRDVAAPLLAVRRGTSNKEL